MKSTRLPLMGAVIGFLSGVGVYWEPAEPYPGFITAAATLSGVIMALLIQPRVSATVSAGPAVAIGAWYGLLLSTVVFLAKGGWASWDAPYVVPVNVVQGAILGILARRFSSAPGPGRNTRPIDGLASPRG